MINYYSWVLQDGANGTSQGYGYVLGGLADSLEEYKELPPVNLAIGSVEMVAEAQHYGDDTDTFNYTMCEVTQISGLWAHLLNSPQMKCIFIPSDASRAPLVKAGVSPDRIMTVGWGIDHCLTNITRKSEYTTPEWFIEDGVKVWWTYDVPGQRKGGETAITAFLDEFGGDPEHVLFVKSTPGNTWLAGFQNPQIYVCSTLMPKAQWFKMMRDAYAFVFPSRGEGIGYPPREFVMAGTPAIVTEWLGMDDAEWWAVPLKPSVKYQANSIFREYDEHSRLFGPSVGEVRDKMRWLDDNYSAALQITMEGQDYMRTTHRWSNAANNIVSLWRKMYGTF